MLINAPLSFVDRKLNDFFQKPVLVLWTIKENGSNESINVLLENNFCLKSASANIPNDLSDIGMWDSVAELPHYVLVQ